MHRQILQRGFGKHLFGLCASFWFGCAAAADEPPRIAATTALQPQAVEVGKTASFVATAYGAAPLTFQWKLNGLKLATQTNSTLVIDQAKGSDEGDYSLVVSNALGAATSGPVRLWVVPPASRFVKGNYTHAGQRLPYFYLLPSTYSGARKYPLFVWLHGSPTDETMIVAPTTVRAASRYLAESPALKVFASANRERTDPCIILWPTRRAGDRQWLEEYLELISGLLEEFGSGYSIDTNRVYLGAGSEGVHAAWDLAATHPGYFAGALFFAGWSGRAPAESLKELPVWVFHAATDAVIDVRHSRLLVQSLRDADGKPVYTEFKTGTHPGSILAGMTTPAALDWLAAQKRGGATPRHQPDPK